MVGRVKALEFQEYALAVVVVLLFVAGAILKPDTFATWDNIRNMLTQASVVGVLAIGHDLRDRHGGNRPVGRLDGGRRGRVRRNPDRRRRHEHAPLHLRGDRLRDALGTVNATAVAYGRVVPFIATLAMFSIARGIALLLNDKLPVSLLDLNGGSFGDPATVLAALVRQRPDPRASPCRSTSSSRSRSLAGSLLNRTRYGRYVVAVGGNREAARIAGVPVRRIIFSVYVLSGLLAGVATVLLCSRLGSASPVSGNLYELDAIGAVVIGGTSLAGGRATIVGTFLGVLTFALIFSLMTQLNLSTEVQQVTKGLIVLGAVLLQRPEARY